MSTLLFRNGAVIGYGVKFLKRILYEDPDLIRLYGDGFSRARALESISDLAEFYPVLFYGEATICLGLLGG